MKYIVAYVVNIGCEEVADYVVCDFCVSYKCPHVLMQYDEMVSEAKENFDKTGKTGYGNIIMGSNGVPRIAHLRLQQLVRLQPKEYELGKSGESYYTLTYMDDEFMRFIEVSIKYGNISCINEMCTTPSTMQYRTTISNAYIRDGEIDISGCIESTEEHTVIDYKAVNRSLAMLGITGVVIDSLGTAVFCQPECSSDIVIPDGVVRLRGGELMEYESINSLILPKSMKEIETRFESVEFGYVNFGGTEIIHSDCFDYCNFEKMEGFENIVSLESNAFDSITCRDVLDLSVIKGKIQNYAISSKGMGIDKNLILPKHASGISLNWDGKIEYK